MSGTSDADTSAGTFDEAAAAADDLRRLLDDVLELLGLETRLAATSIAAILMAALGAAFALLTAWLLLQAAATVALMALGAHPGLVLLAMALVNAAGAFWLLRSIRRLSRNLTFPAVRDVVLRGLHDKGAAS